MTTARKLYSLHKLSIRQIVGARDKNTANKKGAIAGALFVDEGGLTVD
jgi:hypothetical protein